jgi:hypothetical protein
MRTHIIAVTALAGSMLLGPFMLGPSQAGRSPDFKSAVGATHTHAVSAGGLPAAESAPKRRPALRVATILRPATVANPLERARRLAP